MNFFAGMSLNVDLILRVVGALTLLIIVYRVGLSVYRRLIRSPKKPTSYGKWAIVTGSTSGIGKEYADYLAKLGMNLLVISRTKDKLVEQCAELASYKVKTSYLAYDYTDAGPAREAFYEALDKELQKLDQDGGIGILINNVGTTNQYPQTLMELTEKECNDMINCNMHSTVFMTRAVMKYMTPKNKGAIVNVSSGSGMVCAPYIAIYSATKAFITQFSRSMHVENLYNGIDFLVVTPLYVVSNLFKKDTGTFWWPMPIKLVEGTFAQLGKKMVYQGHGYWVHGLLSNVTQYNPFSLKNNLSRMDAHRAAYRRKLERLAKEKKSE